MKTTNIGSYINRDVVFTQLNNINEYNLLSLKNSVLLVYLDAELNSKIDQFIENLINSKPLAIDLSGKYAKKMFDELIEKLSSTETNHHIMTKFDENDKILEIIEDFLFSTWPSEECFDNWKFYHIIFVGDNKNSTKFIKFIESFLDKK
ncbi:MAG: hypothetical protein A3F40_02065 [Chlamydiae bacterium RIFCSPHIGHO2_12_FULL_27_8]|nr:MAG: hypothetical protein A3F40_02065 [Chlamydiae bacterium RIFCSPHIGHO2_12_FULL_27_8]OGN64829.1 MAG: hypothetical protein A2888_00885 [Chlamydiae bacterium RIFCSPLOWO2_01_FULL_28_7]